MPYRLVVGSLATSLALVALTSWLFDMSLERAAVLAPVIVLTFGATVAIFVLWARIALDPLLRRRRQP